MSLVERVLVIPASRNIFPLMSIVAALTRLKKSIIVYFGSAGDVIRQTAVQ